MGVQHDSDLIVRQQAMDVVVELYAATHSLPASGAFGLTSQMRRAAVSVPSNIAEGQGRATTKDFVHFLSVARGSRQELETQVLLAQRLGYMTETAEGNLIRQTTEVSRILNGLIRSLGECHPGDSG